MKRALLDPPAQLAPRGDRRPQDIAGGKLDHAPVAHQPRRLRALAGGGRAEQDQVHSPHSSLPPFQISGGRPAAWTS